MATDQLPGYDEITSLSDGGLDAVLYAAEVALRRATATKVAVIAEARRRGAFFESGFGNVTQYVAANGNLARPRAVEQVGLAAVTALLPHLRQAFAEGRVGVDQAGLIARLYSNPACREHLPAFDEQLSGWAVEMPLKHFRLVVARFEAAADPDGHAERSAARQRRRRAGSAQLPDGWQLHAFGGALEGEEFDAIWQFFVDREFELDWAAAREVHGEATTVEDLARSNQQRRFDALLAMARAAHGNQPATTSTEVVIVADPATTIEAVLAHYGQAVAPIDPATFTTRRCETLLGSQLTREQLFTALHLGRLRIMFHRPGTREVEMGRRQRFHTRAMRLAIAVLDRFCGGPGCERPALRCQIDHAQEWHRDGGVTGVRNGEPNCGPTNRAKHRYKLRTIWHPVRGWQTYRPDGTPITPTTRDQPQTDNGP